MGLILRSFKDGFKKARRNAKNKNGKRYTQESFAEAFGVSVDTVKNWEQGRTAPSIDTLIELCDFFECDMDYLFGTLDCKTHDVQFIHEYIGLSEEAIKRLHGFTSYYQGKIRLAVIDFFLQDIRFSHGLTDMINDYFGKYDQYKNKEQIFLLEDKEQKKLEFKELLEYVPTVSRSKLGEYRNVRDAAHFNIQKEFDTILENLMKYLYKKYSKKAPDTN